MADAFSFVESAELTDFSGFDEENLVLMAQRGHVRAAEAIVNHYKDFVKLRSRAYYVIGADRDDVIQEGMIGLYKAICSYRADKDTAFKTFAELCITRQIISAVKTATRKKHVPLNSYVSFDQSDSAADYLEHIGYTRGTRTDDPEQIILEKEALIGIEGQLDQVLSEFEAQVLVYHLNGVSYGKIADCLGRDSKSIDNALQRIKRKIEKFLLTK